MSQQYLAQCPHCSATFKVQDQHLNAAGGKVRCGSCMQVFNALEQLEEKGEINSAPKESVIERAAQAQEFGNTAKAPDDLKKASAAESALLNEDGEDFVFADNPEEDAEEQGYAGTSRIEDDFDTTFLEMELKKDHQFDGVIDENSQVEDINNPAAGDESWAEKILEDDAKESTPDSRPLPAPAPSAEPAFSLQEITREQQAKEAPPSPRKQDDFDNQVVASSLTEDDDLLISTGDSPYGALRVEPIATKAPGSNRKLKTVFWALLVVILGAGAIGQLAWYNFDKFVQYPNLRPLYSIACDISGCNLPDLIDISKIRSQNLVVRSHPAVKNSLIIDAVIVNKATFEQPFPQLGLHFSDINNNVVAERVFTPEEYLSGEAKSLKSMPIDSPVRLVIEIKDPGTQAVNYSISFRKAEKGA